jgi:hypothetical protein
MYTNRNHHDGMSTMIGELIGAMFASFLELRRLWQFRGPLFSLACLQQALAIYTMLSKIDSLRSTLASTG